MSAGKGDRNRTSNWQAWRDSPLWGSVAIPDASEGESGHSTHKIKQDAPQAKRLPPKK